MTNHRQSSSIRIAELHRGAIIDFGFLFWVAGVGLSAAKETPGFRSYLYGPDTLYKRKIIDEHTLAPLSSQSLWWALRELRRNAGVGCSLTVRSSSRCVCFVIPNGITGITRTEFRGHSIF